MKLKPICIVVVVFTAILFLSTLAWSAETSTPQAAPDQESSMEAKQPTNPTAGQENEASAIQIKDTAVSQEIVDRAPVGSGDVFAKESTRLYCFSRVVGALTDTEITHNWYYKGTLKSSVKLPVRSNNWRTWSSKSMTPEWIGEWMVEILSDEGIPLESIIFFVQ